MPFGKRYNLDLWEFEHLVLFSMILIDLCVPEYNTLKISKLKAMCAQSFSTRVTLLLLDTLFMSFDSFRDFFKTFSH